MKLLPGPRFGAVTPPPSKSHLHRLLIADFLGGSLARMADAPGDPGDILATKRCLRALAAEGDDQPVLDCGESGSTLRFLAPVAAALGKRPRFVTRGRLASRPAIAYDAISPGLHTLPGDVSSQFATGLLFALPLLDGDSEIRFPAPPVSRGYLDLTLSVLAAGGIQVLETPAGFAVPGRQCFTAPLGVEPERDWSGAAFWLAMNALGSRIDVRGLNPASAQPDRCATRLLAQDGGEMDLSQCPDLLPALAVVAGARSGKTRFRGVGRLRAKESDRVAAAARMLRALGARAEEEADALVVAGRGAPFAGGAALESRSDHRVAMAAAVAATFSRGPLLLDDASCAAKSYPGFFQDFEALGTRAGPRLMLQ